jgi:hypothetical protein
MARIDINARVIGDAELAQSLAKLSSQDIPKAIRMGVRDAARAGRTTLAKSIGQRYALSAARIKQDVPTARIADGGQTAVITTSRKPITAMQFKPKETSQGLSISIYRGQRTVVKSGFMQHSNKGKFSGRMPFRPAANGRLYSGDANRTDEGGWKLKARAKPRKGLDLVVGPSIHAIYTGGEWSPALQARTEVRIEDALESGILRALGAMGRGYGRA